MEVCAGANEQQDHEEESLELENSEHCEKLVRVFSVR